MPDKMSQMRYVCKTEGGLLRHHDCMGKVGSRNGGSKFLEIRWGAMQLCTRKSKVTCNTIPLSIVKGENNALT